MLTLGRIGLVAGVTTLATLLIWFLRPVLDHGIMAVYCAAVMISAWYGGLWPGLLATALSVVASDFFFFHPRYSLAIGQVDDLVELGVFSMVAFLISLLNTAHKRAQSALQTSEERLRVLNEKLEVRVEERTAWLKLLHDVTRASNEAETVGQAFRHAVRRLCEDGTWTYCHVYVIGPEKSGTYADAPLYYGGKPGSAAACREATRALALKRGERAAGRVLTTGAPVWIPDPRQVAGYEPLLAALPVLRSALAFPVKIGAEIVAVFECFSESGVESTEGLLSMVTSVGMELGHAVERKRLQEGYSEAAWEQQQKIAHELHDTVGQELTAAGFVLTTLAEALGPHEEAPLVVRAKQGIGRALDQIRSLAKQVFPVEMDAEGLMSALTLFAGGIESSTGIRCGFECRRKVLLENNQMSIHLFRIAQEAVTNAIKHGQPGRIALTLDSIPGGLQLTIEDDGKGMGGAPGSPGGSGLKIMKYRAAAIGGTLVVKNGPEKGTIVTCTCMVDEQNAGL